MAHPTETSVPSGYRRPLVRSLRSRSTGKGAGGTLKNDPHDVLANDEHAVGLLRFTAQQGDRSLQERAAHIVHLRDGKLAEVWFFWENPQAVDAFFAHA